MSGFSRRAMTGSKWGLKLIPTFTGGRVGRVRLILMSTPTPVNWTGVALAAGSDKVPVRVPAIVGLNIIVMVQLCCAGNGLAQLLVCVKSPVIARPDVSKFALDVLVNCNVLPGDLRPSTILPRSKVLVEKEPWDAANTTTVPVMPELRCGVQS